MDYILGHLDNQENDSVKSHLQQCPECQNSYEELLFTTSMIVRKKITAPSAAYYSTILPRVRERLVKHQNTILNDSSSKVRIILPLAVSLLLITLLIRVSSEADIDYEHNDALHQTLKDYDVGEIVQAVANEYSNSTILPNQEITAYGFAEHLQGSSFIRYAVKEQIDSDEVSEIDIDEMVADLRVEQVDQLLSGLSERELL
jgi:predicted anti-sigma-YlaC factor YlaD